MSGGISVTNRLRRDLVEMMGERGIELAHTTILRNPIPEISPTIPEALKPVHPVGAQIIALRRDLYKGEGPVDISLSCRR